MYVNIVKPQSILRKQKAGVLNSVVSKMWQNRSKKLTRELLKTRKRSEVDAELDSTNGSLDTTNESSYDLPIKIFKS